MVIGPLGINFSANLMEMNTFSFKKMHLKLLSAKWRLFLSGLNELNHIIAEESSWEIQYEYVYVWLLCFVFV